MYDVNNLTFDDLVEISVMEVKEKLDTSIKKERERFDKLREEGERIKDKISEHVISSLPFVKELQKRTKENVTVSVSTDNSNWYIRSGCEAYTIYDDELPTDLIKEFHEILSSFNESRDTLNFFKNTRDNIYSTTQRNIKKELLKKERKDVYEFIMGVAQRTMKDIFFDAIE